MAEKRSYKKRWCYGFWSPEFGSYSRKHEKSEQNRCERSKVKFHEVADILITSEGSLYTLLHEHLFVSVKALIEIGAEFTHF